MSSANLGLVLLSPGPARISFAVARARTCCRTTANLKHSPPISNNVGILHHYQDSSALMYTLISGKLG